MIIVHIGGGIGNQLFMYAAARRLAHKLNTELKLDIRGYKEKNFPRYALNFFNIKENAATAEDVDKIKDALGNIPIAAEKDILAGIFMPEVLNWPDNIYFTGCWENEKYFADIADIIREEFTLKNPLSSSARYWKEKILSAECSVSLHFRHGDFVNNPSIRFMSIFAVVSLDYYYECIKILKQQYKNLKLFVFSNNLQWVKENFRAGVPTEFVEGEDLHDFEELHLMSLCKHNIIANSTFSWWGAWLNQNPDKKVFVPIPKFIFGTNKTYRHFSAERKENSPLDTDRWIRIPFDSDIRPRITQRPIFSLLLVVNDDAANLSETLNSLLGQDYRFYELIIIDNASSDGSGKLCRQVAKQYENVTLIKLHKKISNGASWNKALDIAQGDFVIFLKGNDRILSNALTNLYFANVDIYADVVNSTLWLLENDGGNININGKKFIMCKESAFQNLQGVFKEKLDKMTLLKILSNNETFSPLGTRMFKREFLMQNKIRFKEKIGDAEFLFAVESMFQTAEIIFAAFPFYTAPKN